MKKIKLVTILLLFAVFSYNATAQNAGDNDPTFNSTDVGFGFGDAANGALSSTAIQADGKIIIGGGFTTFNGDSINRIARLNLDGSIDTTFNSDAGFDNDVSTIALQSDGKIIVGGSFTTYNGIARNKIARLNADGSLDTTFNPGTGSNSAIYKVEVQADGKIVIVGPFTIYNGNARKYIARLNTDGSVDSTFATGTGASGSINAFTIQPDGKIIIIGGFSTYKGIARRFIARLNVNGTVDTSFNPGSGFDDYTLSIALQSDGKIIVGGGFMTYNGDSINNIARINTDGTIDTSFNVGTGANDQVSTIIFQPDGKIIIGGNFTTYNSDTINDIARLNTDGTLDATFTTGTGTNSVIKNTAIQSDGKIIIVGWFTTYNGIARNYITRLNTNGNPDVTFIKASSANNSIWSTAIQPDGKIIIGGDFKSYYGIITNRLTRLNTDGSLDTLFNSNLGIGTNDRVSTIAIQPDGKIFFAGIFSQYNGSYDFYRMGRLNSDGTKDTTFSVFSSGSGLNAAVVCSSIQPDGKIIIGGGFSFYNSISQNRIARFNINGSLDTNFNIGTGFDNTVWTTAIQPDGKIIVGGNFTNFNGTSINRLARLNTDGTLDTTFNTGIGLDNWVSTTALQSDGKIIIGGEFTTYNGIASNYIARLNFNGSIDTTFNIGVGTDTKIYTSLIQSNDKIIIGGDFSSYNGTPINRILRLNSDGTLDNTFNPGIGADDWILTTALQPDNKLIIGGFFTSYNNIGRNRIARLLQCTSDVVVDTIVACDSITWIDGNTYTSSTTTPSFHVFNSVGCDSAVTLNLTINATSSTDTIIACDSITWMDGNTYTSSTSTPTFTLPNAVGCDSIITLNLTINSTSSTDIVTACDSITWIDGNIYTVSTNTPTFTLTNAVGCDSVVTLNLTINANSSTDVVTACDSITWIDGNTYTSSTNTPTFTLTNAAGCDSLVTLNLTVNNSTFSTDVIAACDSITWIDGNTYSSYTTTPTFTIVGGAVTGCDSIVTLNLTINNSTSSIDIVTACDSITWIDGNTYTVSTNTPTYILTNASGCDSIVTLNLTINNPSTGTDIIIVCDSITWLDGNTYTSSTTTPTFTIVGGSSTGCDSVVTLNLTISPIDISVVQNPYTIVALESGATYQWLDCNNGNTAISGEINQTYIPASSGNYAVVVSKNGCVDTSACINFCNIDANYLFNDNGNGNYTFTNATSGNYTQSHWAFGDGTTSTATNPNHTFTVNNTFAVVLTVNDSTTVSSCMDYYIDVINVTGVVSPLQCAAGFTMYADTNNINVILNATGTNLTYLWDFGDGNTSNAQFPTHTYATTGNYYLCLTIDDGAGCVDMYCDSIGENGVVFNKQTGFTINIVSSGVLTQIFKNDDYLSSTNVYPNPTLKEVVIELKEVFSQVNISIFNINGKILYNNSDAINSKFVIDVENWSKGIYVIKITSSSKNEIIRFVKQ